uniref:non-specific serine/threonine protein kinase n=1 Tax=Panthera tigris altaica TaxID=74533 RepID=A0A8C9K805_PANTA
MDVVRFKLLWTTPVQIGHRRRCWRGESRSESFFAFRRSTFCSIIAQLTEETQPLFETTLKSRAVSEDSDVRFTCIVTGYPEPEVTWYKDDVQLDRYCGLPKYEIMHQGNRHTLQLYRCQEEDAAIYQASARNTKGIVSCSGVLEVGTMTEYKIHQRWFAKLKRKAAAKLREIEQSWKPRKEVAGDADTLRKLSPDRFQRTTEEAEDGTLAAWQVEETEPGGPPGLGLINSFVPGEVTTNGEAVPENGEDGEHGLLTYIYEAMELAPQRAPQKESGAKKKKKDEEPKQGLRKPELEKAARSRRSSENRAPSSDKPEKAPPPGADQEGYFPLKDLYLESTRGGRPPGKEGPQAPSGRAPGETSSGKVPSEAGGERGPAAPGQPTRPFNRRRFAPPKPKEEPATDSMPDSSLGQAPEPLGKASPQASAQVPTPPARRRHGTRDSPLQGRGGHRTPGEVPESQANPAPTMLASNSASTVSSRSQGVIEPMDTETRVDQRMTSADQQAGGKKNTEADGKRQVARRTQGDRTQTTQRTQADREPQVDTEPQDSERTASARSSQEDVVAQGREGTQVERTQADERTQEERRIQEDKGTRSEGSMSAAIKGQSEKGSVTSLSPQSRAPERPPSEGPQSPQIIECFEQTPEGSSVPEEPGLVLRSEETAVPGAPAGGPKLPAQQPPQGGLEQRGGVRCQGPEWSGPVKGKPEDGLIPCPKEEQPGAVPSVDVGGCPPAGRSPEAPTLPSLPGPGLTQSSQEARPGTPTSQHISATAFPPSGDQALLRTAPPLHLGPGTPAQSHPQVQAGRQALAAARGPGPSTLTVPAFLVGEEEGPGLASEGSSEGEGEVSLEGPGLLGTSQESSMGAPLGEAGGHTASGQGPLSADRGAQEAFREEEAPGEALRGLPPATPEELALGARRKRFLPKVRAVGDGEAAKPEERESPTVSPRGLRKGLAPGSPGTPGREKRSPTQGRKAGMLEVPRPEEAGGLDAELAPEEGKQDTPAKARKAKELLKAPQVIRKIRVEQFPDASGSLKLWCQFFNILSDSVLTWAKDQRPVGEVGRSAGDEGPAALAIVQASPVDCGVYRCTIHNEHGSASTDFCLSPEVLSGFVSREEGEVGEEIEMTPMVFAKGLADSGCWGDKLFGRLVSEELRGGGHGYGLRKASQAKVIYGLEPIFESGRTCIIKVSSLLVFGPSSETSLLGRNYDVTIQGCKIQNMSREYCKIFAAEAQAAPGFGEVPEILPLYLIYRPANNIPYATLEEDLGKPLQPYCSREWGCDGVPRTLASSCPVIPILERWGPWNRPGLLNSQLSLFPGVDWKMTDVQIATKLRGYQGLKESCFPALLDQFASSHQCNTFCEMLGLKPLKGPEAAHPQAKAKGSKSPSAGRKGAQPSPQPQRKGPPSPQGTRKNAPSSKAAPQASEALTAQLLGQPPIQEGGLKAQGMR